MQIKLRDYQVDIDTELRQSVIEHGHTIVCSPTGSGKGVIIGHITLGAQKKKSRTLLLAHRDFIIKQLNQHCVKFGIQPGNIKSGSRIVDNYIQIAMVQTLVNLLSVLPRDYFKLIITDECHRSPSATYMKIYDHFNKAVRLGFTATMKRTDGKPFYPIYKNFIKGPEAHELVSRNFLVEPVVLSSSITKEIRAEKHKIKDGEYDERQETKIMAQKYIVQDTLDLYNKYFNGAPGITFCPSVEDCKMMAATFRAAGWKAEAVWGNMEKEKRGYCFDGLATGKINILFSRDLINEGYDLPVLFGVIWRRLTKSIIIWLQGCGRSMRLFQGKKHGLILDQVGNVFNLGHPLEIRNWSLYGDIKDEKKKEIKQTECPDCHAILMGKPRYCKYCGFIFKDAPATDEKQLIILSAPLEIIKPPTLDSTAIEAADILEYGNGQSESELIDRTLRALRNRDEGARERFNAIMRMMGKKTYTEKIWKEYIEPEYERRRK